jgi:hypothetical protein
MTYRLKWEEDGVFNIFSGNVTQNDVFDAQSKAHSNARFDSVKYIVSDFLDIEDMSMTHEILEFVSARDYGASRSNQNIKHALVAEDGPARDLVEAYIQTLQKLDVPWDVRQFYSMDPARMWASSK